MLTDIRLPKLDGLSLFRLVRHQWPTTIVILATAFADVHEAIAAVREGAHDYLRKPLASEDIALRVQRIRPRCRFDASCARRACSSRVSMRPNEIVGRSVDHAPMMDRLNTIAASDAPVLLLGESGTGKELVARALHDRSPRRGKPFVAVNCAAFPDTLLEAELFGHERGAFTGRGRAARRALRAPRTAAPCCWTRSATCRSRCRPSCCASSRSAPSSRSGTNARSAVDVRVIAATHRNLGQMIRAGLFREDLYYRLNVLSLDLPPLRERHGDLPLLAQYFLNKFHRRGSAPARVSSAAWAPCRPSTFLATSGSSGTQSSTPSSWRVTARSSRVTSRRRSPRGRTRSRSPGRRRRFKSASRSSRPSACGTSSPTATASARRRSRSWAALAIISGRSCGTTRIPTRDAGQRAVELNGHLIHIDLLRAGGDGPAAL